jgi:hypothetical protein
MQYILDKHPDAKCEILDDHLREANLDVSKFISKLANILIKQPEWVNGTLSLTQLDAACLVAQSMCCMHGNQYDCIDIYARIVESERPSDMTELEFYKQQMLLNLPDPDDIYILSLEKLKLLFNYFEQLMVKGETNLSQIITVRRISGITNYLSDMERPLAEVTFVPGHMQTSDPIKVDFANKDIGGGVLRYGCCQEELMFLANPELIGLMSLVDTLEPSDAIIVNGITQYNEITGYGYDMQFAGSYAEADQVPQTIIMIDAIDYRRESSYKQWDKVNKYSELQKAMNGFKGCLPGSQISTGNWGCGAFRGDIELKFIIQWLAATITGTNLTYYSDKSKQLSRIYEEYRSRCGSSRGLVSIMINYMQ